MRRPVTDKKIQVHAYVRESLVKQLGGKQSVSQQIEEFVIDRAKNNSLKFCDEHKLVNTLNHAFQSHRNWINSEIPSHSVPDGQIISFATKKGSEVNFENIVKVKILCADNSTLEITKDSDVEHDIYFIQGFKIIKIS